MIGTIRWNIALAAIGFALTFLISYPNNVLSTTALNSVYSAIIMFLSAFAFRWVIGVMVVPGPKPQDKDEPLPLQEKGATIDLTTPAEQDAMNDLLKKGVDDGGSNALFTPLNPPKLVSKIKNGDPEELTQALRQMSEE